DLFRAPQKRQALLWKNLPLSWAKEGEQLCALCALKRLWPTLFAQEVKGITGKEQVRRFVVSTHTMALVRDLVKANVSELPKALEAELRNGERVAMPARFARERSTDLDMLARVPALLDAVRNDEDERCRIESKLKAWLGRNPEAYYGLILFDGDKMGAWLQGNEPFARLKFEDCWHTQVKNAVQEKARQCPELRRYLEEHRPPSPARHAAISAALNSFALHLARYAVEEAHHGKLLYAGGDDVMAMVPVAELLSCMRLLRLLYAGHVPDDVSLPEGIHRVANGFVHIHGRLLRVMGERATASAGAVVAHHMTPLGRVLNQLRDAEKQAKSLGGRDAFSIRVLKRSGGAVATVARWFRTSPLDGDTLPEHPSVLLEELASVLGGKLLSRRAVYHVLAQLERLPDRTLVGDRMSAMLEAVLTRQFMRQFQSPEDNKEKERIRRLASRIAELSCAVAQGTEAEWLKGFLSVAEFLGREGRMGDGHE
ncbi:MAG: type III-B CRISPR-associated protein Cas10/Cmr2, partial [Zetaproteobacteria bacterium]